ncbi:MAG: uracil-DNA glycosylase [Eubacteriales bacterium]
MVNFGNDWDEILADELKKEYYLKLREFLKNEYMTKTIYPDMNDIFNALKYTPYKDVKVVILGQDPYHGPGQAHGLAFSVKAGVEPPPSLKNIFLELENDVHISPPKTGCLIPWAKQGILLLNTVLTVRKHQANSHKNHGWEIFTNKIISLLNEREYPVIFMLWGSPARAKASFITNDRHYILQCAHPSPFSASGFFGCHYFSKANEILKSLGSPAIDWNLE